MAVELAFQLGVNQGNGGGAARAGGGQVDHGAAGAAQVFVRRIHHQVGVGGVVQRGDLAVFDTQRLVYHLHHRGQAVGGATGSGDDVVDCRVIQVVVDPHHDVQHAAYLDRSGHDHALGPTVQMALQRFGREEFAGAFQHHVHTQLAPGNLGGGGVLRKTQLPAIDADAVGAFGCNVTAPAALHGVELHQMGGGLGVALDFIQMHHLQAIAGAGVIVRALHRAECGAQRQPAHAAHAVDTDSHVVLLDTLISTSVEICTAIMTV